MQRPWLDPRNFRHARVAWVLAWLALALNVVAPIIAYGRALSPQADAAVAQSIPTVQSVHHHAAGHHHHDAAPQPDDNPVTPHCQYCLDFAAGAPPSLVLAGSAEVLSSPPQTPSGRGSPAIRVSPVLPPYSPPPPPPPPRLPPPCRPPPGGRVPP